MRRRLGSGAGESLVLGSLTTDDCISPSPVECASLESFQDDLFGPKRTFLCLPPRPPLYWLRGLLMGYLFGARWSEQMEVKSHPDGSYIIGSISEINCHKVIIFKHFIVGFESQLNGISNKVKGQILNQYLLEIDLRLGCHLMKIKFTPTLRGVALA